MEAGLLIPVILGGAEELSENRAAAAKKRAIDSEMEQQRIAADQQTLNRNNALESIMSTQEAEVGARGISPSSASLQALNLDQFNALAKDQDSINLGLSARLNDLNQEKRNIDSSELSGVAQNLFDLERFSENIDF